MFEFKPNPIKPLPITCVIMAAGVSSRFQTNDSKPSGNEPFKNKLLVDFLGKPILQWTLDCFSELDCISKHLVIRDEELPKSLNISGFNVIWNKADDLDPSLTIKKAIRSVTSDSQGCLFAVGDQPFLTISSVYRLCLEFIKKNDSITALSWKGKRGNPMIFPRELYPELSSLKNGSTGRTILEKYPEKIHMVDAFAQCELMDIDTQEEYIKACNRNFL